MRELLVPYALDTEGRVVAPLTAPQGVVYICLECGQRLTLRRRRGQRPHFTHLAHNPTCTGESAPHLAAKHLLREQLLAELEARGEVVWYLKRPGVVGRCRDHATLPRQFSVPAWDAVELEVPFESFRFDVAVIHRGRIVFGFEVCFRHEVPEAKAAGLRVPWLELAAEDILAFRPRVPYRRPSAGERCGGCESLAVRLAERSAGDEARSKVNEEFLAEAKRVKGAWEAVLQRAKRK